MGCGPQIAGCGLRATDCGLRSAGHRLLTVGHRLQAEGITCSLPKCILVNSGICKLRVDVA